MKKCRILHLNIILYDLTASMVTSHPVRLESPDAAQFNDSSIFYGKNEARNGEDKHYGLGLAIAKAIAVGHRGKIEVKCHDGKVQFIFSLPAEKQ